MKKYKLISRGYAFKGEAFKFNTMSRHHKDNRKACRAVNLVLHSCVSYSCPYLQRIASVFRNLCLINHSPFVLFWICFSKFCLDEMLELPFVWMQQSLESLEVKFWPGDGGVLYPQGRCTYINQGTCKGITCHFTHCNCYGLF